MTRRRRVAGLLLAACCSLLVGCASRSPLLEGPARQVELDQTPFHPQLIHQCGPAALATVLGASGVEASPDSLAREVYVPGRRGSLQIEMQAAPRRYGRLAYALDPDLAAITAEIDAGRPVLVLHNYGLPFWPRWHYAVVIGYDAGDARLWLRSGTRRRQEMSARHFMRAWDNGGRWALVLLRPGELPAHPRRDRFLEAAAAFERTAAPGDARLAFDAALRAWPQDAVALVGRGTARYRAGDLAGAARDYASALEQEPMNAGARNNLAMTRLMQGCSAAAARIISGVDEASLSPALRAAIADTRAQIAARAGTPEAAACSGAD